MHSENNGTKVWRITCLFGREYKFTPWSCNVHTLQIPLQFNQASKNSIYHSSKTSHKIIETKQCMQACQRLFYLEKWFLLVQKHLKTPNGHFIKWKNHLYKILLHKPFLNQIIILCGEEMLLIRQHSIGFIKYVLNHKTLCLGSESLFPKHFYKVFLENHF